MSRIDDEIKKINPIELQKKLDIINKREKSKNYRGSNAKFSLYPLTFPEAMYVLARATPKRLLLKDIKGKPKK